MKTVSMKIKHKGQVIEHVYVRPDSIHEALQTLGPNQVYEYFLEGLLSHQRKLAKGWKPRERKHLRLDLSLLHPVDREIVVALFEKTKNQSVEQPKASAPSARSSSLLATE